MDVYQLARLGPIQFVCCERSGRQQANKLRKLEASRIYQKGDDTSGAAMFLSQFRSS